MGYQCIKGESLKKLLENNWNKVYDLCEMKA